LAKKSQRAANGHAQASDALLVINHHQFNFQVVAHGFPKVFSTIVISFCTRKGFSRQGVALLASNDCVSLLAVSPLINIIRLLNSGRFLRIHSCTSAPLMDPGMRMSEITPANAPASNCFKPAAPEDACTTLYPRRSSAARTKALTEGSSSITRIVAAGRGITLAVISPPLSQPLRGLFLWPPAGAPQTCSRFHLHCSSKEFLRRARAQFRSRCSTQARSLCQLAW